MHRPIIIWKKKKFSYKQYAKALFFKKNIMLSGISLFTLIFLHYCLELLAAGTFFLSCFFFSFFSYHTISQSSWNNGYVLYIHSFRRGKYIFQKRGGKYPAECEGRPLPQSLTCNKPALSGPWQACLGRPLPAWRRGRNWCRSRLKQDRKVKWDTE